MGFWREEDSSPNIRPEMIPWLGRRGSERQVKK